jgi:PAS domain S-box-containing protein
MNSLVGAPGAEVRSGILDPSGVTVMCVVAIPAMSIEPCAVVAGAAIAASPSPLLSNPALLFVVAPLLVFLSGLVIWLRVRNRRPHAGSASEGEMRFRELFEQAPVGYQSLDEHGIIIEVNEAWCSLLGYAREEVIGKPFKAFIHPDHHGRFDENFPRFKEHGQTHGIEFRLVRKDGTTVTATFDGRIGYASDGSIRQTHCVLNDITQRKEAERTLRESEEKFRSLFDHSPIGIAYHRVVYDDAGKAIDTLFVDANPEFRHLVGVDPRGRRLTDAFPGIEDDTFNWVDAFIRVGRDGAMLRIQQLFALNQRWYDIVAFQIGPDQLVVAFLDITEQRATQEALQSEMMMQQLLLAELDHRVRNNLSSLLALIELSRARATTTEDFADSIKARTQAIASIHSILSDGQWRGGDLEQMLRTIALPLKKTEIRLGGPPTTIPTAQTQALGLVLNELTTNSLKYGAMSVDGATVDVSWSVAEAETGEIDLTLVWVERGGPRIESEPTPGTGVSLVTGLTRSELRGSAELTFPREGAEHTLRIRLAERATTQFNRPGSSGG